jgi:death-on-curing protein
VRYLDTGEIIYINETQVGPGMVRDYGLLEAAVMRPHQTVMGQDAYPTIHDKAAALTHSLIKNHPFVDGNKRTALLADIAFYGLNGYVFRAPEPDIIHFIVDIASGSLDTIGDIARPLERWTHELPGDF